MLCRSLPMQCLLRVTRVVSGSVDDSVNVAGFEISETAASITRMLFYI